MIENETNFDFSFMTDDEIEKIIDDIVLAYGQEIIKEESRTSIVDFARMKEIAIAYKILQCLCNETDAKVSYTFHEPFQSVGCVTIIGKNLVFENSEWFIRACGLASNIDVYPRTDGAVRMDLTFHGLTKPIE